MQGPFQSEKISLLFADGDKRVCTLCEMYGASQDDLEVCAAVDTAQRVLELLRAGLRPQALVLDALLPGCGVTELLHSLREFLPEYRPFVMLTSVWVPDRTASHLLTLGADYIIFKPYHFSSLFTTVNAFAREEKPAKRYEFHRCMRDLLEQLGIGVRARGGLYLERMVWHLLTIDTSCSAEELYDAAARQENLSTAAVSSAVYRLGMRACAHGGETYARLCRLAGEPEGTHLANSALIRGAAEYIHTMLR